MIGRKIIQIESCDSTNNYIANLISVGNIKHGTVILAEEQTKGKGQRGASWLSKPSENMIFSMYLNTANLSVKDQFVLTQFVSVSVVNTLRKFGLDSVIKWPNDILIEKKKMAGILIENQLKGSQLNGSIIGIGLNVNQTEFGDFNATSIKLEKGSFYSIQEIVFSLLNEMNLIYQFIIDYNFKDLEKLYLDNLWLLNEPSNFIDEIGEFEGVIRGVEGNGLLQMERNGEIVRYDLKEISFMRF